MVKNPPTSAGDIRDVGLIPGPERSLGGGIGTLAWRRGAWRRSSRGAWRAMFYRVAKSWIQLKQLKTDGLNEGNC